MQTLAFPLYKKSTKTVRVIVFSFVIFVHILMLLHWSIQFKGRVATNQEMEMSFSSEILPGKSTITQPQVSTTAILPLHELHSEQATPEMVEQAVAVAPTSFATSVSTEVNTEPDYKATYLNNPFPTYPMVARRMGLQGRVVLNVEVLASGVCGTINIHKSSGYAMLDNAALQTVKGWRFMPARQSGNVIDKWFMIPIQFSMKDKAA